MVTTQNIVKNYDDKLKLCLSYYKMLFGINNIPANNIEMIVIAFANLNPEVNIDVKNEIIDYIDGNTNLQVINNYLTKLKKRGIITKENKLNDRLRVTFSDKNVITLTLALNEKQIRNN
jgi:hypothetical protein